jgi:hypothetical protein
MHPGTRKPYAAMLIALMFGLLCTTAHANVAIGAQILGAWIELLLLLAVAVVIEAIVYRGWLPIRWFGQDNLPGAVAVSALANVISAIAGFVASDLILFRSPLEIPGILLGCFVASLFIEFPVVWLRVKAVPRCPLSRAMTAVLVANALSYAVIACYLFI